ncbi:NAD(P)H-binding protein [Micromonospora sp. M12]
MADALTGAEAVVDVSNSPSFEDAAVLEFFETSTRTLLAAASDAGVTHYVALSIVGCDRIPDSGYMCAKVAQEKLVVASGLPYSVVHATQFFEFLQGIIDTATDGDTVHLAPVLIQPMAADDVAAAVAEVALGAPTNSVVEVAGPEQFRLDELGRSSSPTSRTAVRWCPTPTPGTSAPSWANARSFPPTAPASPAPASTTGVRGRAAVGEPARYGGSARTSRRRTNSLTTAVNCSSDSPGQCPWMGGATLSPGDVTTSRGSRCRRSTPAAGSPLSPGADGGCGEKSQPPMGSVSRHRFTQRQPTRRPISCSVASLT